MTRRKIIVISLFLFIIFGGSFIYKYEMNCVKKAISPISARKLADNNEYFIIYNYGSDNGGGLYYIDNGEVPVVLIGKAPHTELAWPISGVDAKNSFLVKGHIDYKLSELTSIQVIDVEEWEIIAPIVRSYEQEDDNKRVFYPLLYIDKYDMETNVYFDVNTSLKAVDYYEKERLFSIYGEMHEVTSAYVDGHLQWYIKVNGNNIPVEISGNNPEAHFDQVILSYENNNFLVAGLYYSEQNIIIAEEWFIEYPIIRIGYEGFYESKYYFENLEIDAGIYIP